MAGARIERNGKSTTLTISAWLAIILGLIGVIGPVVTLSVVFGGDRQQMRQIAEDVSKIKITLEGERHDRELVHRDLERRVSTIEGRLTDGKGKHAAGDNR